jgi:hypothetical protein
MKTFVVLLNFFLQYKRKHVTYKVVQVLGIYIPSEPLVCTFPRPPPSEARAPASSLQPPALRHGLWGEDERNEAKPVNQDKKRKIKE